MSSAIEIARDLCHEYGWTLVAATKQDRHPEFVAMRRLICSELRTRGYSLHAIANVLHRDHSTVLHHLSKSSNLPLPAG